MKVLCDSCRLQEFERSDDKGATVCRICYRGLTIMFEDAEKELAEVKAELETTYELMMSFARKVIELSERARGELK